MVGQKKNQLRIHADISGIEKRYSYHRHGDTEKADEVDVARLVD